MRQDPLLNGHVAAVTMPVAMSRAYSRGRDLQKISAANAVPHVLDDPSGEGSVSKSVSRP